MRAATWFCMVPAYSVNKQASFRLKPNNRVKVHFCNEKDCLAIIQNDLREKKKKKKVGFQKKGVNEDEIIMFIWADNDSTPVVWIKGQLNRRE